MIRSFEGHVPVIGEGAYIDSAAQVIGRCRIGAGASVWPCAVLRGDIGDIVVGDNTSIQDNSTLHVLAGEHDCIVGARCTIGHNVNLHGCVIEDECVIGIGAIVLDGARVGRGSVVAAGTLVPPGKIIPPGAMVMGSPGKVVRMLGDDELTWIRSRYVYYADYTRRFLADPAPPCDPAES
jgi:carbonic anhydrase/acetyltransferase-like protein (isoleucine patch superfamily)